MINIQRIFNLFKISTNTAVALSTVEEILKMTEEEPELLFFDTFAHDVSQEVGHPGIFLIKIFYTIKTLVSIFFIFKFRN